MASTARRRPELQVFDATGSPLAGVAGWNADLKAAFAQVGVRAADDAVYTAHVSGIGNMEGVALVEAYEMEGTSRLLNLSTRTRVRSGVGLLISGLLISGAGPQWLLLRAAGPALVPLGVSASEVLADPTMTVLDGHGAVVASNDNWEDNGQADAITGADASAGALPFAPGSKDAALVADLAPGSCTIQVRGVGDTGGIALLESFALAAPDGASARVLAAPRWDRAAVSARLGPTFAQLNPDAKGGRPTLYKPESKMPPASYYVRIKPYELGSAPGPDSNYWSESGQVAYVPDDPANNPGLDRIQVFAYYNKVFAISPRLDWASGQPSPDPQTQAPYYVKINGTAPMQPVAMVRNYAMEQNEALVLYRDGLFAVAGTQTSRSGSERPYPGFKFPANKIPRAIAVTTGNEFALVAVTDTDRHVGQLAIVALEGKYIPFHTWPYMAMPNEGSWSDFKLLGYVDLPMATPDAVAAASNGLWRGASATNDKELSQIDLADDNYRKLVYDGAWQAVVAKNGYAIVSSTDENKVAVLDLTPLFNYVRENWLGSEAHYQATLAARGDGPAQFPQTFDVNPAIRPKVIWTAAVSEPTAVLAGQTIDRWSHDRFKAYVASRDGTVHIYDTSPLMWRYPWETKGKLQEIGTVKVGRNPTCLAFARFSKSGLPLLPVDDKGKQRAPDPLNNLFYAASRGDDEIDAVVTWGGEGAVYWRIRDSRMDDPVAVSVAQRANIVTVADFAGKKILSFRVGAIKDARNGVTYGCGADGNAPYEFAGELSLPGSPFAVNSTNVN